LKDRISLSTLSINFYERIGTTFGFASKFMQAISGGWELFLLFIIGFTHLWPFVLMATILIVAYKVFRKRRKSLDS